MPPCVETRLRAVGTAGGFLSLVLFLVAALINPSLSTEAQRLRISPRQLLDTAQQHRTAATASKGAVGVFTCVSPPSPSALLSRTPLPCAAPRDPTARSCSGLDTSWQETSQAGHRQGRLKLPHLLPARSGPSGARGGFQCGAAAAPGVEPAL